MRPNNTHRRLKRLESAALGWPDEYPVPVRILVPHPDGTPDPDYRPMAEGEARERGLIWIADVDDRPGPEDQQ